MPVVVNLAVGASADGTISIFSQDNTLPSTNIIETAYALPVGALYNDPGDGTIGSNALFKFQGRTNDNGGIIEETIVGAYGDDFTTNVTALTEYLASILQNQLKCGADVSDYANVEFLSDSKYQNVAYQTYNSLGDLALATYAHYLFGHVQATAAINNDVDAVDYFNLNDPSDTTVEYTAPDGSTATTGATKANIAYNLAQTIINNLDTDAITTIVRNVLAQDASRARFEDNDQNDPNRWQHLVFKPDDVVFVQVTLDPPRLTFGDGQQFENNVPDVPATTFNFRIAMNQNGGEYTGDGSGGGGGGGGGPTNISVTSTSASASLTAATSYTFTNNTGSTILITLLDNSSTPIAGSPLTVSSGQTSSSITGASSYTVAVQPPPNLYYEAFVYKGATANASTVTRTYFESQMGGSVPTSWWKINEVTATNSRQFILTDYINGVLTSTALGLPDASGTSTRAFMINNTLLNLGFTYSTQDNLFIIEYVKSSVLNENYISDFVARLVSGTTYNVGTSAAALLLPFTTTSTKGNVTVNSDLSVNVINSGTAEPGGFDYFSIETYGANDMELKFTLDTSTNTNNISTGDILLGFVSNVTDNKSIIVRMDKGEMPSFQVASKDPNSGVICQYYNRVSNKGLLPLAGHTLGMRYVAATREVTLYDYTTSTNIFAGLTPSPNDSGASAGTLKVPTTSSTYKAWINSRLSMTTSTYTVSNISVNSSW